MDELFQTTLFIWFSLTVLYPPKVGRVYRVLYNDLKIGWAEGAPKDAK